MSPSQPEGIEGWPLATRVADVVGVAPNGWRVLIAEPGHEASAGEALVTELRSLIDEPVVHCCVRGSREFIAAARTEPEAVHVISLIGRLGESEWRSVDMHRTELGRLAPTLLVVAAEDAAAMVVSAPNLWSWIGGAVWTYQPERHG